MLSSFQKTKFTQTNGSVFAERIEQVQLTQLELELRKKVGWFLECYDNFISEIVSLKMKSLKTNQSLNSQEICIN